MDNPTILKNGAFDYDRSEGWEQRTFDEHNANVITALRSLLAKCRVYASRR